jgi:hybrid cluster-associated redox disulfide protein
MRHPRPDDPDLPLANLMTRWPQTVPVFVRHRMLCVGCLVSPFHTVMDACAEYGLDEEDFLAELMQAAELG